MKTAVRLAAGTMIAVLLPGATFGQAAESESGSVCIAPVPEKPDLRHSEGLFCDSERLSLRIDTQPAMPWPIIYEERGTHRTGKSVKIDGLDAATRHRVVVLCNGKPQQSSTFRFSEFKTNQLCLFINGLYKTVQLWEAKGCPWCKCK